MKLSRYFRAHSESYQAEIDDLTSDSEGHNVLTKRLEEKRGQIDVLVMMMDESPEMLASAFHRGFSFPKTGVVVKLIGLEPDAFPAWSTLASAIQLTPWAKKLAERVLAEPQGERFLTVTACLEYLYAYGDGSAPIQPESSDDDDRRDDGGNPVEDDDGNRDEHGDDRDLDEAGGDWMEQQGFDRKA
jgi:hypothetical protein